VATLDSVGSLQLSTGSASFDGVAVDDDLALGTVSSLCSSCRETNASMGGTCASVAAARTMKAEMRHDDVVMVIKADGFRVCEIDGRSKGRISALSCSVIGACRRRGKVAGHVGASARQPNSSC
jgi:hypothetical protein